MQAGLSIGGSFSVATSMCSQGSACFCRGSLEDKTWHLWLCHARSCVRCAASVLLLNLQCFALKMPWLRWLWILPKLWSGVAVLCLEGFEFIPSENREAHKSCKILMMCMVTLVCASKCSFSWRKIIHRQTIQHHNTSIENKCSDNLSQETSGYLNTKPGEIHTPEPEERL